MIFVGLERSEVTPVEIVGCEVNEAGNSNSDVRSTPL